MWLPLLVASVGRYTFSVYIHIRDGVAAECRVYDGGCGQRLIRYFKEYASFGQADYQTWRRLQAIAKKDQAELAAVGL